MSLTDKLNEMFEIDPASINKRLVDMAKSFGGKVYLVGGAVRDELLGKESKDLDYLVTKISLEDLSKLLPKVIPGAKISEVGQSFGIVKAALGKDEFDFAIPRADVDRENVKTDPNIPVEQDLMRRDFTINALAKDLETGQIVSPEGQDGVADIKNKIIRAVGDPVQRFKEDPLRMLRALQFASRFGFDIDPESNGFIA
jgi:tRNA nucleotidyltransferase (CCA-adding enzyme)